VGRVSAPEPSRIDRGAPMEEYVRVLREGPMPSACEFHDVAGECTEECVALMQQMSTGFEEPRVYGDYLGGESSVDWSRTHEPEPRVERVAQLDVANRRVIWVEVCPFEEYHDATDCDTCSYLGQ